MVVLEARQVKTTLSSLRSKTDRNDARGIAQILRTGWYREVHVKGLDASAPEVLFAWMRPFRGYCTAATRWNGMSPGPPRFPSRERAR